MLCQQEIKYITSTTYICIRSIQQIEPYATKHRINHLIFLVSDGNTVLLFKVHNDVSGRKVVAIKIKSDSIVCKNA